jgi:cell wall-associated NlpC family hydrolase
MNKREIAQKVAWNMLGKPYLWGGDDAIAGFDCSGFCIEILKSVGTLPRGGDWTAQMLWDKLKVYEVSEPRDGCLVFWNNSAGNKIIHVEFAINSDLCIGASGGGSKTLSAQDAIEQNAYIKVRPWGTRKSVKGFIDPFV